MPEKSQPIIWHSLSIFRALCCRMEHERAVALGGKLGSLVARLSRRKVAEAVERCMKILGVPGIFAPTGSAEFLLDEFGMSPIAVADAAVELIARKAARA